MKEVATICSLILYVASGRLKHQPQTFDVAGYRWRNHFIGNFLECWSDGSLQLGNIFIVAVIDNSHNISPQEKVHRGQVRGSSRPRNVLVSSATSPYPSLCELLVHPFPNILIPVRWRSVLHKDEFIWAWKTAELGVENFSDYFQVWLSIDILVKENGTNYCSMVGVRWRTFSQVRKLACQILIALLVAPIKPHQRVGAVVFLPFALPKSDFSALVAKG